MIEDNELNTRLRDALEADGAFAYRPRRKSLVWGVPVLLAASVTLVVALNIVFAPSAAADPVSEAIGLLSAADGFEPTGVVNQAELLAAWQEAPLEASLDLYVDDYE